MPIYYLQDSIQLLFEYEKESLNAYQIYIINVAYDGRSLIDQKGEDTKDRLFELCTTLYNDFDKYNQDYDGPVIKLKRR